MFSYFLSSMKVERFILLNQIYMFNFFKHHFYYKHFHIFISRIVYTHFLPDLMYLNQDHLLIKHQIETVFYAYFFLIQIFFIFSVFPNSSLFLFLLWIFHNYHHYLNLFCFLFFKWTDCIIFLLKLQIYVYLETVFYLGKLITLVNFEFFLFHFCLLSYLIESY